MDRRSARANGGVAITPHDSNAQVMTALYVGGAGDAVVQFAESSSTVTLVGLAAGQVYPFNLILVKSTGTTATNMVALR